MVVCKFFLQGTCKFGDYCKFEHQINDSFNSYGTSILRKSHFGAPAPQSQSVKPQGQIPPQTMPASAPAVDTNTLVKSVVNDMTLAEKGGQWPFSCYAPFKEKPAFPGFEDQSFEELRYAYLEAVKSGSLEQYKQQVQLMIQQAQMKIKSLQNPSPDVVTLLKNIYNTPPSSQSGVFSGNIFNSPNTSSLNQQGSGFGQQGTAIFAQANQNLFSGNQQQQQAPQQSPFGSMPSNVFGSSNQTSIFGGQTATDSPFGTTQAPQAASTGVFGKSNFSFAASGNSIFGGQQPPSQQQSSGSIFAGNANAPQSAPQQGFFGNQNVFGQPAVQTSNTFGSTAVNVPPQAQANIFGSAQAVQNQQPPASIFGAVPTQPQGTSSIFGQQTGSFNSPLGQVKPESGVQAHSSSIFGGSAAGTLNSTVTSLPVDDTLYSKLEELTEEEIKWFESDDLDIMKIPEKPPTYNMCFKT